MRSVGLETRSRTTSALERAKASREPEPVPESRIQSSQTTSPCCTLSNLVADSPRLRPSGSGTPPGQDTTADADVAMQRTEAEAETCIKGRKSHLQRCLMFPLETAELTTFYVSRSPAEQHLLGESQTLQRTMAGGSGQWRKATRVIPSKGRGRAERARGKTPTNQRTATQITSST